jgi:hypothetical protein
MKFQLKQQISGFDSFRGISATLGSLSGKYTSKKLN